MLQPFKEQLVAFSPQDGRISAIFAFERGSVTKHSQNWSRFAPPVPRSVKCRETQADDDLASGACLESTCVGTFHGPLQWAPTSRASWGWSLRALCTELAPGHHHRRRPPWRASCSPPAARRGDDRDREGPGRLLAGPVHDDRCRDEGCIRRVLWSECEAVALVTVAKKVPAVGEDRDAAPIEHGGIPFGQERPTGGRV
jgi:hypothetical protein